MTSGSASLNEFGKLDGQISSRDNDKLDETRHGEGDTALSHTATDAGPGVEGGAASGGNGKIVRTERVTYPDGKTVGTRTVETAKAQSRTFTTKEGSGHFVQDVHHTVFRNFDDMPAGSGAVTSGSASLNEFGKLDGQISSRDNDKLDETRHGETDTALSHAATDAGPGVDGGTASGGDGRIVRTERVTYPDGKTVGTRTVETAKAQSRTFTTKEGSGHFVQDVHHTVFRNFDDMPAGSGAVTSGSASLNEFGKLDGQISSRDNDKLDETRHGETDTALSHTATDSGPAVAGGAASGGNGKIVRTERITYPDGKTVGTETTESAKEVVQTFSYTVYNGEGKEGTVTVKVFRNATAVPTDGATKERTQHITGSWNEFDRWDGVQTLTPTWYEAEGGTSGAAGNSSFSYQTQKKLQRRVRNKLGKFVDQTRTDIYTHDVLAGSMSVRTAYQHLGGGDPELSHVSGPGPVKLSTGTVRRGYVSDKVTVKTGDWMPAID